MAPTPLSLFGNLFHSGAGRRSDPRPPERFLSAVSLKGVWGSDGVVSVLLWGYLAFLVLGLVPSLGLGE